MSEHRVYRLERAQQELRTLVDREQAISKVHERYAKFGSRVVQQILRYGSRPSGLRELTLRLPSEYVGGTESQTHDAILRFLHEHGVTRFLAAVDSAYAQEVKRATSLPESSVVAARARAARHVERPPAPAPFVSEPPAPAESGGHEAYVDRRRRGERRQAQNRRSEIQVIFKNKRYGGDRRRKSDRRVRQMDPPWPRTTSQVE